MMAPGDGQALRQPGSAQCMQPSLRISHSSVPFCSCSAKRISVQLFSVRSCGFWYEPSLMPTSSRRSFHSWQADWQALQPMHLVTSMSLATSCCCRCCGGGVVVAERRVISRDCSDMAYTSVRPFSSRSSSDNLGVAPVLPSQRRLGAGGLGNSAWRAASPVTFSTFTRNALNSGVCVLASPR